MNDTEEILWLVNTFGIFGITEEDLRLLLDREA